MLDLDFVHNFWTSQKVTGEVRLVQCHNLGKSLGTPCCCREIKIVERIFAERVKVLRPGGSGFCGEVFVEECVEEMHAKLAELMMRNALTYCAQQMFYGQTVFKVHFKGKT